MPETTQHGGTAQALVEELKIKARLHLNASRRDARDPPGEAPRLRHSLNHVARTVGFTHWEHARHVLGGQAVPGEDWGKLWWASGCAHLLNLWFSDYAQAQDAQRLRRGRILLPYARQFVVVDAPYIAEIGLLHDDPRWAAMGNDAVHGYGQVAWNGLVLERLRSWRTS